MPAPAASAMMASAANNERFLTVHSFDWISTAQLGATQIVRAKESAQARLLKYFDIAQTAVGAPRRGSAPTTRAKSICTSSGQREHRELTAERRVLLEA